MSEPNIIHSRRARLLAVTFLTLIAMTSAYGATALLAPQNQVIGVAANRSGIARDLASSDPSLFADVQNENPGSYLISNALTYISGQGWTTATGSISSSVSGYDLLVVSVVVDSSSHYYTTAEKQAVTQFLQAGKVVLLITADNLHPARVQICNDLLSSLGVSASFSGYYTSWPTTIVSSSHPLATSITGFSLSGGYPIVLGSPTSVIARDSSSYTVLAECKVGTGSLILTTWQIFCMTSTSSDVQQFIRNLLSYAVASEGQGNTGLGSSLFIIIGIVAAVAVVIIVVVVVLIRRKKPGQALRESPDSKISQG